MSDTYGHVEVSSTAFKRSYIRKIRNPAEARTTAIFMQDLTCSFSETALSNCLHLQHQDENTGYTPRTEVFISFFQHREVRVLKSSYVPAKFIDNRPFNHALSLLPQAGASFPQAGQIHRLCQYLPQAVPEHLPFSQTPY